MKKLLTASVLVLSSIGAFAQYHEQCGSNIVLQRELEDPENRAKYEAFQEAIARYTADPNVAVVRENGVRIIPVVFHILHEGGSENISLTKVQQQLNVLNEDYRRLNPDTVNTPQRFYGDTEYTSLVFNDVDFAQFTDDSAYVKLSNRYGTTFGFHFKNGSSVLSDSLVDLFDVVVEVNVASNADTADFAMALADAIDDQTGLSATYAYENGDHRVNVSTDGLGYVDDVLLAHLWDVTANIEQQGKYIPADCNIEFRLATKDPLGNCTDGVVRVFTSKTNDANNGTGFKAVSYWNAYSYLNVWVINNIDMDIEGGGTVLGYAQFPASGLLSTDGIAVRADNIGLRNQGGRTSTHEVGHWLSLIHIWGDSQCGSDNVADTPIHNQPNFGICGNNPAYLSQYGGSSTYFNTPYNYPGCDPSNPDGEMFSNYMDYSSDMCMNMFTLGQKARMDFTLHGDGTDPGIRSYLISAENLAATGVADPYVEADCAPVSAFYFEQVSTFSTQKMLCAGENVRFEEASYNGDVDDFSWAFEGGEPSTSTDDNPLITYNNPGIYDVSLQVSNSIGSDSHTENDMVIVSSTTAQYQNDWGYVDSYWSETDFLSNYYVFNYDGSDNKWEWYYGENGGSTGWESIRMFNLDNDFQEVDEVVSPSYNLSTLNSPTLKFRYSGAAVDNTPDDELRIMVSDDCGETWTNRQTISGFDLCNAGLSPLSYRPSANSTWTDVSVGLGTFANKPNVRVKFRWISGGRSNNFYIDDLTISNSPLSMDDVERMTNLTIAPNPTNNFTTVTMNLLDDAKVAMEIVDIMGRDVKHIFTQNMSHGSHRFDVDLSSYQSGVYFLRIYVDNDMMMKKIVKN